jgi:hypothetical protein
MMLYETSILPDNTSSISSSQQISENYYVKSYDED